MSFVCGESLIKKEVISDCNGNCRVCISSGESVQLHSLFEGDSSTKEMFEIISGVQVRRKLFLPSIVR